MRVSDCHDNGLFWSDKHNHRVWKTLEQDTADIMWPVVRFQFAQ